MWPVGHFEVLGLSCFRGHFVLLDCGHCYCSGGRSKSYPETSRNVESMIKPASSHVRVPIRRHWQCCNLSESMFAAGTSNFEAFSHFLPCNAVTRLQLVGMAVLGQMLQQDLLECCWLRFFAKEFLGCGSAKVYEAILLGKRSFVRTGR